MRIVMIPGGEVGRPDASLWIFPPFEAMAALWSWLTGMYYLPWHQLELPGRIGARLELPARVETRLELKALASEEVEW